MLPSLDLTSLTSEALVFDIETNGLLPKVSKLHTMVTKSLGGAQRIVRDPWDAVMLLNSAPAIIGHNIVSYDIPALEHLTKLKVTCPKIVDTMVLSRLAFPMLRAWDFVKKPKGLPVNKYGSHSLKAWGFRLGVLKGEFGETEGAFDAWSQDLENYCIQDVEVTAALYNHLLGADLPALAVGIETELQEIIAHQERHGFAFDSKACQLLVADLQQRRDKLLVELQEQFPPIPPRLVGVYKNQEAKAKRIMDAQGLTGTPEQNLNVLEAQGIKFKWTKEIPFNPASDQQVAKRLMDMGWVPTDFTETGQPSVDEDTLSAVADAYPAAKPLIEYSMLDKRLGQMVHGKNAWLKLVGEDGRMHGRANTMGTVTFRFTHSTPNMGQVPSCRLPYGRECRSLFHVPAGHALVGCDVSGLELRVLGHYLARLDGGKFIEELVVGDIHTRNKEAAGLASRDQAKTFIYALLYGAGDAKIGEIVCPAGTNVSTLRKTGGTLKKKFLNQTPALRRLTTDIQRKVARFKTLKAIDGRTIQIRSAHSALNALIQCTGSIIVKAATVLFRRNMEAAGLIMGREWSLVVHVHDEWQTEVLEEHAETTMRIAVDSIKQAGELLGVRCPLTGEAKRGRNWADTH